MSAARNRRLAWLSQEISKGKSNATIVAECLVAFPGTSEKTVRKELKELFVRMTEINLETLPETKTKYLEIGFRLMEEARGLAQLGPASNLFKTLATIAGVMDEKGKESDAPTGTPENALVRDRIQQLLKNKNIRKTAEEAGIDLDALKDE